MVTCWANLKGHASAECQAKGVALSDLLCSNEELRPSPSLLLDIDIKIICNVHDGTAIWKLNMGSKSPEHQQTPDGMISTFPGKVPNSQFLSDLAT
jgi:hypothetical protein